MKICHITSYLPKYHKIWAGAEIALDRFVKILYENDQENIVLSTKPIKKVDEFHFAFYGIKTLEDYLGFLLSAAATSLIPFDFVAYYSIKKRLKEIKPDVVHLHNFGAFSPSIVYALKSMDIPIVFSAYDYWSICPVESLIDYKGDNCKLSQGIVCWRCVLRRKLGFARIFLIPLRTWIFKGMLRRIDQLNVLSETWALPFKKVGISKEIINVVPLPLPGKITPSKSTPKDNTILFIGWIDKRKGLEIIAKAMPIVCSRFNDAKLYVVGPVQDRVYKDKISLFIKKNN